MSLTAVLDEVIALLEADIPANPASEHNERLAAQLEREMARYFQTLESMMTPDFLDQLYYKYAGQESGRLRGASPWASKIGDAMEPLVRMLKASLEVTVQGHLTTAYLQGNRELVTWGQTKGGIPIAYEGPPLKQAIDYAKQHGAQLVTRMNDETKRRLASVVGNAVNNKRGVEGLARDVRSAFADMTKSRSEVIARTETCDALEQAFMDGAKSMGITGKEWVVSDPCDICEENGNAGVIPLKDAFPSGDDRPPAHPNCRCALAPVMLAKSDPQTSLAEAMTPRDWKAEYQHGLPHWAEGLKPSVFAKEFVTLMKSHKQDSFLEVGCGNGRDSILFAKSGFRVTSIDVVPKAVKLAGENAQKSKVAINFIVANVEDLPFENAEFGAVFSLSVLHSTDLKKSLPEVYRVINPGGIAFIYIYGDTQFKTGKKTEDVIDWRDYQVKLKALGFKILESYTKDEGEFDEYGEKHRIFVVHLEKAI